MTVPLEALLARPVAEDTWDGVRAMSRPELEALADELKGEVDRLVRASPAEALEAAGVLVRLAEAVPSRRAEALRGRASANHINGHADEALADYVAAAAAYDREGRELEAAKVRRSMIDVHQMSGRSDEALACADAARSVFEAHGERRLLCQLEVNVGNVHFRRDDLGRARAHYETARSGFEELGDALALAITEYNLGNLEANGGRFDEAERAYRAAREEFERAGMDVHVADCDYAIAIVQSRRGRFGEAVSGLESAREAYADGGKPAGVPLCDLHLAELLLRLDARWDALERAREAAARFDELGLEYERARSEVLSGAALARLGRYEPALEDLDRAARSFERLQNEVASAALGVQRAAVLVERGEARASLDGLRAARGRLDGSGHRLITELGTVTLARALTEAGEPGQALELLARGRGSDAEGSVQDILLAADARLVEADAELALGRRLAAVASLRGAVEAIERTYARVPGSDVRLAFFRDRHRAFLDLAWMRIEDGGPEALAEAISLLERSRQRSLADPLARRSERDAVSTPAFDAARERMDALLGRLLDAELGAVAASDDPPQPPADEELVEAQEELARLARARVASRAGNRAATWAGPGRFDVGDLGTWVRGDELVLAYVHSHRGAKVLTIDGDGVGAQPLELDGPALAELKDRLALQMRKFELGRDYLDAHRRQLLRSAERLQVAFGDALLGPVADRLDGRPLVIVPFGDLHDLPFHAFRVGGAPLVQQCEVAYAPSLAALRRCRVRPPARGRRLLAVGAAERGVPRIGEELARLERRYGAVLERVDPGALLARLRDASTGARALHVAAHGSFRAGHPVLSGLRLGEGFLTAHDVQRMELDFDLVTLSGCETGRHHRVGGEELFGLRQAFLAAGVGGVVSSLWPVLDSDSAACMDRFYAHLSAGVGARAALALAQRERMAEDAHPFAWASYCLAGDPDAGCPARPGA